jgi:hypothetical protein
MTFENDDARRAYFIEKLRERLRDPAFRKVEGFPIGEDEDILALSDPPYFTACPNPFVEEFLRQHARLYDGKSDNYRVEPSPPTYLRATGITLHGARTTPRCPTAPSCVTSSPLPDDVVLTRRRHRNDGLSRATVRQPEQDFRRAIESERASSGQSPPVWEGAWQCSAICRRSPRFAAISIPI